MTSCTSLPRSWLSLSLWFALSPNLSVSLSFALFCSVFHSVFLSLFRSLCPCLGLSLSICLSLARSKNNHAIATRGGGGGLTHGYGNRNAFFIDMSNKKAHTQQALNFGSLGLSDGFVGYLSYCFYFYTLSMHFCISLLFHLSQTADVFMQSNVS